MTFMGKYILSLVGVIILAAVSNLFFSDKKLGKYLNYVFSSLVILLVITPVVSLVGNGFKWDGSLFDYKLETDQDYLNVTGGYKIKLMEKGVEDMLADKGYKNTEVTITGEMGDEIIISDVRVNLTNLVMDGNLPHINKYDKIRELVATGLNIGKEKVSCYE